MIHTERTAVLASRTLIALLNSNKHTSMQSLTLY